MQRAGITCLGRFLDVSCCFYVSVRVCSTHLAGCGGVGKGQSTLHTWLVGSESGRSALHTWLVVAESGRTGLLYTPGWLWRSREGSVCSTHQAGCSGVGKGRSALHTWLVVAESGRFALHTWLVVAESERVGLLYTPGWLGRSRCSGPATGINTWLTSHAAVPCLAP